MAQPPPTPSAGTPPPPPLFNFVFVMPGSGLLTVQAISMFTSLWAYLVGNAGLDEQVQTIQNMHGDGTLALDGTLTITKTNGVAFGYFATGTDAANLTGTLSPARIAVDSIPWDRLVDAAGAMVLGASGAGALVALTAGPGIDLSGGKVSAKGPVYTFGSLPAAAAGLRAFVSDSSVAASGNFGAAVAGGGANFVPVYSDGSSWFVG